MLKFSFIIYSSLGQILYEVISNENDAAETSLLHDQKDCHINFHYLRVFWQVKTKNALWTHLVIKQNDGLAIQNNLDSRTQKTYDSSC